MDFKEFIGKEVLNKNNERGQTVSFDEERIIVRFNNVEKIFNPKVAFTSHFLTFVDDKLNRQINEEFVEKEIETTKRREDIHQLVITRHKRVNQLYQTLKRKDRILRHLFGPDFIYPPFKDFKKQYRCIIDKEPDWLERFFRNTRYY